MSARPRPFRRDAIAHCAFAAVTVVACAGLFAAVALVPAPPVVLPFAAAVCIGFPMLVAWQLPGTLQALVASRHEGESPGPALAELRRELAALPETNHPLGL
jgi:hypothetical protein